MNLDHLRQVMDEPDLSGTKYRLLEFIGAGGMGSVYGVLDTELDRRVALKVLRLPDPSGELTARMIREAKILAALEHPGIVPVHDIGRLPDARPFYVSKLVKGTDLSSVMRDSRAQSELLRILQQVCDAVAFAHTHDIIHRDLKPGNILVGEFGEVLVMDWGIAKSKIEKRKTKIEDSDSDVSGEMTAVGSVIGTRGYMSPEQERGEAVDERSDIFALGAILKELTSQRQRSKLLAAIANKAMSPDSTDRYQMVTEFSEDLSRFLSQQPVDAYPENLIEKSVRWISKNRFVVGLVIVYVLVRLIIYLASPNSG